MKFCLLGLNLCWTSAHPCHLNHRINLHRKLCRTCLSESVEDANNHRKICRNNNTKSGGDASLSTGHSKYIEHYVTHLTNGFKICRPACAFSPKVQQISMTGSTISWTKSSTGIFDNLGSRVDSSQGLLSRHDGQNTLHLAKK